MNREVACEACKHSHLEFFCDRCGVPLPRSKRDWRRMSLEVGQASTESIATYDLCVRCAGAVQLTIDDYKARFGTEPHEPPQN